MQELLLKKLYNYLAEHNPDVLITLQHDGNIADWLMNKVNAVLPMADELSAAGTPGYHIEELCMDQLTAELRPSRFNYLLGILEEDFETQYYLFRESGVLTYELINMIAACKQVFDQTGFTSENEDDRLLRYAVIAAMSAYLQQK